MCLLGTSSFHFLETETVWIPWQNWKMEWQTNIDVCKHRHLEFERSWINSLARLLSAEEGLNSDHDASGIASFLGDEFEFERTKNSETIRTDNIRLAVNSQIKRETCTTSRLPTSWSWSTSSIPPIAIIEAFRACFVVFKFTLEFDIEPINFFERVIMI